MISIAVAGFLTVQFAAHVPEAPWRQPQVAANGSTVVLAFGAGKGIYFFLARPGEAESRIG